jgi:hypothetical protein
MSLNWKRQHGQLALLVKKRTKRQCFEEDGALRHSTLTYYSTQKFCSSKPKDGNQPEPVNSLVSAVPPAARNLSKGLAGTLIERIITEKNKESRAA